MSKDYYSTLGVSKSASQDEIKKAFYKLAGQYHPDKPNGNEAKFKEVNEAYQVLSDAQKRAQYDQFGSNGPQMGGGGGSPFGGFDFSQFGGGFGNGGFEFQFGGDGNIDLNDIMSELFGGGGRRNPKGRNIEVVVQISFKDAIFGCSQTVSVPNYVDGKQDGKRDIRVDIPAGVENGMTLEMRGQGEQMASGRHGNLHLRMSVPSHKVFRKEGRNLVAEKDIKLSDAVLGGSFQLEMLDGKMITIDIPAGLQPGAVLRVRGKGVGGSGDLLIATHVQIPKKLSKEAKKAIEILQREGL
jgi:DnaJ-class molecular chaperone